MVRENNMTISGTRNRQCQCVDYGRYLVGRSIVYSVYTTHTHPLHIVFSSLGNR